MLSSMSNLQITIDFFFWCSDEVIIEIENGHHVTRGELMCLRPEMWINDGVMNAQVHYLQEKGSRRWYFPTYVSVCMHSLLSVIGCVVVNNAQAKTISLCRSK